MKHSDLYAIPLYVFDATTIPANELVSNIVDHVVRALLEQVVAFDPRTFELSIKPDLEHGAVIVHGSLMGEAT